MVQADYQRFLLRAADSGGLSSFVTLLQNGARDEELNALLDVKTVE